MINVYDLCFDKEDKRLELIVKNTIEEDPPRYPAEEPSTYDPTF